MNNVIFSRLGKLGVNDEVRKYNNIIKFRTVLNDVAVGEWQRMPEITPPTLQGLVKYLNTCPGWDYRNLQTGQTWNNCIVDCGLRSQFLFPCAPTEDEIEWLNKEKEV